jgi:hypothetical protein
MNLKKSDKIIAIIGVIILIVAGIGIVLYSSDDVEEGNGDGKKETVYDVKWVYYSDGVIPIEAYAGKNKPHTEPITISLEEGHVITSVNFKIVWKDDYTKGIIFNKGEDTLRAVIGVEGSDDPQEHTSTKSFNDNISSPFFINEAPSDVTVKDAENIKEVEKNILDEYQGKNTVTFNVKVNVRPGEKLLTLRPIKLLNYLRDKGNNFEIIVYYEYYKLDIEEVEKNNPNPPTATGARVGSGVYTTTNFAFSKL